MRFLLDTHVLVWLRTRDPKLWKEHLRAVEQSTRAGEKVGLAAITLWELAKKHASGKLRFVDDIGRLLEDIYESDELEVLPITAAIALESTRLGISFPADPADQLIAATARVHGLRLLTADDPIRASGAVDVI